MESLAEVLSAWFVVLVGRQSYCLSCWLRSSSSSFIQVAMNRAQVCLISSSKSGERHLYLIKVSRDKISDNSEQETSNYDAKGNCFICFT